MRNFKLFSLSSFFAAVALIISCTSPSPKRSLASFSNERDAYSTNHGDTLAPGDTKAALGRDIWIKATVGNSRFFAYTFPQRISGKSINWPDFLLADKKTQRFQDYGLVNDPDCCSPSVPGECQAKFGREISAEETYGFDFCPGDEDLLRYVGHEGYRDPACDLKNDVETYMTLSPEDEELLS